VYSGVAYRGIRGQSDASDERYKGTLAAAPPERSTVRADPFGNKGYADRKETHAPIMSGSNVFKHPYSGDIRLAKK
jgi:hypothetical protein